MDGGALRRVHTQRCRTGSQKAGSTHEARAARVLPAVALDKPLPSEFMYHAAF